MAQSVRRRAVSSVASRKRARELAAGYEERAKALLEGAEEFLAIQAGVEKSLTGIEEGIRKLELEAEQVERAGWERGAQVAARMRKVGAREDEVAARLGVGLGEVRKMLAHVKETVTEPGGTRAAGAGPVAPAGGSSKAEAPSSVGTRGPVAGPGSGSAAPGGGGAAVSVTVPPAVPVVPPRPPVAPGTPGTSAV